MCHSSCKNFFWAIFSPASSWDVRLGSKGQQREANLDRWLTSAQTTSKKWNLLSLEEDTKTTGWTDCISTTSPSSSLTFETEKEMIILGSELLSLKSWEQEEAQSKLFSPPDKEDLGKTSAPSLTKGVFGCGGIAVFCHKLEGGGWTGSWCPDVEMVSHGRISRHEHVLSLLSYNEFVNLQAWGNGPHTCNYSRFCVLSAIWVWCSPPGFIPNFRRLWKQNPNLFFPPLSSSSSSWETVKSVYLC